LKKSSLVTEILNLPQIGKENTLKKFKNIFINKISSKEKE